VENIDLYEKFTEKYNSLMFGRKYIIGVLLWIGLMFFGDVPFEPITAQIVLLKVSNLLLYIPLGILLYSMVIYALYLMDMSKLDFKISPYKPTPAFQDLKRVILRLCIAAGIGGFMAILYWTYISVYPEFKVRLAYGLGWFILTISFGGYQLFWARKAMIRAKRRLIKNIREKMSDAISIVDKDHEIPIEEMKEVNEIHKLTYLLALQMLQTDAINIKESPIDAEIVVKLLTSAILPLIGVFVDEVVSIIAVYL
jgi:hypothetical protein